MSINKLLDGLDVASLTNVDELEIVLHLDHKTAVLEQVGREVLLQNEKFVVELVLSTRAIGLLDDLLPHAHELPLLELLEEGELPDTVVGVALDQPLAERNEFDRRVVLVESQALARERVVLV